MAIKASYALMKAASFRCGFASRVPAYAVHLLVGQPSSVLDILFSAPRPSIKGALLFYNILRAVSNCFLDIDIGGKGGII